MLADSCFLMVSELSVLTAEAVLYGFWDVCACVCVRVNTVHTDRRTDGRTALQLACRRQQSLSF